VSLLDLSQLRTDVTQVIGVTAVVAFLLRVSNPEIPVYVTSPSAISVNRGIQCGTYWALSYLLISVTLEGPTGRLCINCLGATFTSLNCHYIILFRSSFFMRVVASTAAE
jgi:hypothetical protein